jgi:two-component system, NtrC family, nitrogen regulation sensor histidine kinase GlnL
MLRVRRLKPMAIKKPAILEADPQEHRWTQIIESLEEGVIGVDAEGRILSMNQAAEQLTGCPIGSARGRHHDQVFAEAGWISELLEGVRRGDQGSLSAEGTVRSLWQKAIPVRASASAILDSSAQRVGAALILQDLTLQRALETDVRRAQSLAHLGVMVAGLAHEIRNPLGGIRGAVQLLSAEVGPGSTGREYIELVLREVDRLTKLLEQLLELRPRGPFIPKPVNIHQVIDHVIALLDDGAKRQRTPIHRFFDPSLPEVSGDPDALTQLLLNLVQNALQAVATLPEGAPRILRLTTRMETDYHLAAKPRAERGRGRLLRIDVEDSGPGIPAEVQPNLFAPFVTTKPKGTGLGLAICQRIVADHGGTIRFESEPGRTLFRVTLPAWAELSEVSARGSSSDA